MELVLPKRLLVVSDTLEVGSKRGSRTELLPALGAGTNIGFGHLIPIISHVFLRSRGRFGGKSVIKNADEILRDEFLRLEAVGGVGESGFNTRWNNTAPPGVSTGSSSKNVDGEAFLSERIVLLVD